jgi:alpha-tubulin suppressor-like RCC1 family protein
MEHSLALTAGGEVYSWGNAANGRLGHGSITSRSFFGASIEYLPRLVRAFEALRVGQVAAGQMHSAAVSSEGDAFFWGYGKFYALGTGQEEDVPTPMLLTPLKGRTAAVACGSQHSLALLHGGDVLAWGADQVGTGGAQHTQPVFLVCDQDSSCHPGSVL